MTRESETVTLTREMIEAGRTENGGFTKYQLDVLGVPWPPPKGWLKGAVGRTVDRSLYAKFVAPDGRRVTAERKREIRKGKTTEERVRRIRVDCPPTEFEVRATLYSGLLALGWQVRGEIGTTCRAAPFDLVVLRDGRPVRLIEVKKSVEDGGKGQARDYTRFGVDTDLVSGMEAAQAYLDHVRLHGGLPEPTCRHVPPFFQRQESIRECQAAYEQTGQVPDGCVIVTEEMFLAAARSTGAYSAKQLAALGVPWPLKSGWKWLIIGQVFRTADYERFVLLGKK